MTIASSVCVCVCASRVCVHSLFCWHYLVNFFLWFTECAFSVFDFYPEQHLCFAHRVVLVLTAICHTHFSTIHTHPVSNFPLVLPSRTKSTFEWSHANVRTSAHKTHLKRVTIGNPLCFCSKHFWSVTLRSFLSSSYSSSSSECLETVSSSSSARHC